MFLLNAIHNLLLFPHLDTFSQFLHWFNFLLQADERYQVGRNTAYVSKWLKKSMRQFESFDTSIEELKYFFNNVKVSCMFPLSLFLILPFPFFFMDDQCFVIDFGYLHAGKGRQEYG